MKTKKNHFGLLLTSATAVVLSGAVVLSALVLAPTSAEKLPLPPTENSSVLSSEWFAHNPNSKIDLTFGGKNYSLGQTTNQNLQTITNDLYIAPQNATVQFDPTNDEVFVFQDEVIGQEVDVTNLANFIHDSLKSGKTESIAIPVTKLQPAVTKKDLEGLVKLRSEFSTSIVGSEAGRKHNVAYALKAFNGLIVMPNEEVSFNKVTGERTFNNQYQDAIIISGGKYVKGRGGGVCQASTTLYNALIRADVEILNVQNHSLPVKYVPLAFDAMVNDTTSDLVFKNTTNHPLYFLTGADDERVWVKIFGEPMPDGLTIKTRTETVREIKKGDKIIPDENGEYAKHITFKGEYYRVKYPQNGKECKGFLQYFINDKLVEEKEVRHSYYQGQDGIIMEGTEDLYDGMTLPDNTVSFITGN